MFNSSKKKSILFVLIIGIITSFISGCIQDTAEENTVSIENFSFNPNRLTIAISEPVTWINNDDVDHTVTAEGIFDSGVLEPGDTFDHIFYDPGTYNYTCSIHPEMSGTIIVSLE